MSDIWERLSLFESRDILAARLKERHGGHPSDRQCRAIIAHLAQGRQYFGSASGAGNLVRPLLLYYGVVALARSLILFENPRLQVTNLVPRHGLEPVDWSPLHGQDSAGLRAIANLQVQVTGGTFSALCGATGDRERAELGVHNWSPPRRHMFLSTNSLDVAEGVCISLKDILGRLPELMFMYKRAFGVATSCMLAFPHPSDEAGTIRLELIPFEDELPQDSEMRKSLGVDDAVPLRRQQVSAAAGGFYMARGFTFTSDDQAFSLPLADRLQQDRSALKCVFRNDEHANLYLVPEMAGGLRLSSLAMLYLVSYFAGMLVRYYPVVWQSLLSHSVGDSSLPVLMGATTLVEKRFPELIFQELWVHP